MNDLFQKPIFTKTYKSNDLQVRNNKCSQDKIIRKSSRTNTFSPSTKKQSIRPIVLTRTRATQTDWTCNNKLQGSSPRRQRKKNTVPSSKPSKPTSIDRLRCISPEPLKKIVSPKQSQKIRIQNELSATSVRYASGSPERLAKAGNKTMKKQSRSSLAKRSSKRNRENSPVSQASYVSPVVEMPSLFADASIIFLIL